ncbi:unnamed protein product [Prorocentrum cordatum]|uniref:Uncharacterized protein n=1 Tax=Prorocentrum cordatum TaxID=2364126 RepID=A0ABN9WDA5_9DINO|nr:unnamed protein product [Polarella glacialis]
MRSHAKSPPLLPGMAECIFHICGLLPNVISECSPQDITNTLWGIARLFPGGASGAQGHVHRVSVLSHAIIRQCAQRVAVLTSQSMANSFWAMARLEARGPDVERYVGLALDRLRAPAQLEPFTPQGLANVLWALARRRTAGAGGGPQGSGLQPTLLAVAEAAAGRLLEFQAQELSMVAWSYGKLYEFRKEEAGPARGGRASPRPAPVNDLLRKLAAVAAERIDRFEDQGVSNIAWALATLGLTGAAPQAFLEAAMVHCTAELGGYSAQAVANLLWACVRMDNFSPGGSARSTIERFCSAVAEEMMRRMTTHPNHLRRDKHGSDTTVSWRDVAGVAVALSHWGQNRSRSVMTFMILLSLQAAEWVAKGLLTSQQMFNIARSAARLHVPREHMQKLVDAIEACIMIRGLRLNDIDKRQWEEVQQWCPSGEASNAGMLYDTWD